MWFVGQNVYGLMGLWGYRASEGYRVYCVGFWGHTVTQGYWAELLGCRVIEFRVIGFGNQQETT